MAQTLYKYSQDYSITDVDLLTIEVNSIDFSRIDIVLCLAAIVHQLKGTHHGQYFKINQDMSLQAAILQKSLIEAASVGLAIKTTNTVGCRECVDERINGFLVPIRDSEILAEKMIILIENPEMRKKMNKA